MSNPASEAAPINVVVLAAGKGERFLAEGVTIPKPLISWKGRTLLEHSLDVAQHLAHPDGRIVVVATDAVAGEAYRALKARGVSHYCRVVAVSEIQAGPVESGLLAAAHLPIGERVVFMDCDNHYADLSWVAGARNMGPFITVAALRPGMIRTDYCNVELAEDGTVDRLAEKSVLSGAAFVGTGIYGFSSFLEFANSARLGRAAAMSRVCFDAAPIWLNAVKVEGWQPLGTPSQLAAAK